MSSEPGTPLGPVVNAIWDLRDHAYDHPKLWERYLPVDAFQAMGEILDRASDAGDEFDWSQLPRLVQEALFGPEANA